MLREVGIHALLKLLLLILPKGADEAHHAQDGSHLGGTRDALGFVLVLDGVPVAARRVVAGVIRLPRSPAVLQLVALGALSSGPGRAAPSVGFLGLWLDHLHNVVAVLVASLHLAFDVFALVRHIEVPVRVEAHVLLDVCHHAFKEGPVALVGNGCAVQLVALLIQGHTLLVDGLRLFQAIILAVLGLDGEVGLVGLAPGVSLEVFLIPGGAVAAVGLEQRGGRKAHLVGSLVRGEAVVELLARLLDLLQALIVRGVELFLHAHVDYIQNGPSHGSVVRGLAACLQQARERTFHCARIQRICDLRQGFTGQARDVHSLEVRSRFGGSGMDHSQGHKACCE
mmetsp:Transcript_33313/g.79919  ORF Transcript_33313/g.79919 Transcript_33313/m.79919 type:complete len:340 (+) Transcript_33313:913-1932(+)